MNDKRKNSSRSPIRYWWDEFLFARHFEYETDLSPEDIQAQIEALAHERQGWFWGLEKTSKATLHANQKGLDFLVENKRKRWGDIWGMATARAQGTAVVDGGTGMTQVRGSVRFGRLFHIYMLLLLFVFFAAIIPLAIQVNEFAEMAPIIPIWAVMFFAFWGRMYADRNELAETIQLALTEKQKHDFSRLEDADSDSDLLYQADDSASSERQS